MISRLSFATADGKLKALRELKNQIIGNRTKKLSVVSILSSTASAAAEDNASSTSLLMQSAAAVGSFACGLDFGVNAVLYADAFPHLLESYLSS